MFYFLFIVHVHCGLGGPAPCRSRPKIQADGAATLCNIADCRRRKKRALVGLEGRRPEYLVNSVNAVH